MNLVNLISICRADACRTDSVERIGEQPRPEISGAKASAAGPSSAQAGNNIRTNNPTKKRNR